MMIEQLDSEGMVFAIFTVKMGSTEQTYIKSEILKELQYMFFWRKCLVELH